MGGDLDSDSGFLDPPSFEVGFPAAESALSAYVKKGQKILVSLSQESSVQEAMTSEKIKACIRLARMRFIERFANKIYSLLTENFTQSLSLSDFVYKAAERFPDLLPSQSTIAIDANLPWEQKSGYEIDQAIFFRGILNSPLSGTHLMDAQLMPSSKATALLDEFQQKNQIDLGSILLKQKDGAAHIEINNQKCLNAEDNQLMENLEIAVDLVLLDHRIKVAVMRGGMMTHSRYMNKRVFSAGIHLADLNAGKISYVDFILKREFGLLSKIKHGLIVIPSQENSFLKTIQKPWIAVIDSFAIGGGMQLALVFDKVIAANDAYFWLPAAQEGIIPGVANFRLPRMYGSRLARQMILSGKKIMATDPEAKDLCDEVVPSDQLDIAISRALQEFDHPAVIENKRMLVLAEESRDHLRDYLAQFAYIQALRLYSSDVRGKLNRWTKKSDQSLGRHS